MAFLSTLFLVFPTWGEEGVPALFPPQQSSRVSLVTPFGSPFWPGTTRKPSDTPTTALQQACGNHFLSYLRHSPRERHFNHLAESPGTGNHPGHRSPSPISVDLQDSSHVGCSLLERVIVACKGLPALHSFEAFRLISRGRTQKRRVTHPSYDFPIRHRLSNPSPSRPAWALHRSALRGLLFRQIPGHFTARPCVSPRQGLPVSASVKRTLTRDSHPDSLYGFGHESRLGDLRCFPTHSFNTTRTPSINAALRRRRNAPAAKVCLGRPSSTFPCDRIWGLPGTPELLPKASLDPDEHLSMHPALRAANVAGD